MHINHVFQITMKKYFFTLVVSLASLITMSAQEIRYQGEVDLGASITTEGYQNGRPVANFRTIHGARVGDYLFAGLGFGADWYFFDEGSSGDDSEVVVPVFLNLKGYYPVKDSLSPFISLDLGYGFGVTQSISGEGGFVFSPAIGLQYRKFQFQIGYERQSISGLTLGSCNLRLGIVF